MTESFLIELRELPGSSNESEPDKISRQRQKWDGYEILCFWCFILTILCIIFLVILNFLKMF